MGYHSIVVWWLEVLLRRFRLRQPPCWFAWNLTILLQWSHVHHVYAFDLFQSYDCIVDHSLRVNTKKIDYFHIEGKNIGDVDCCIKTRASRYVHACPPPFDLHSISKTSNAV